MKLGITRRGITNLSIIVAAGTTLLLAGCSPREGSATANTKPMNDQAAAGSVAPAAASATGASPASTVTTPMTPTKDAKMAEAMFGAGCFWGVEETFRTIPGVIETSVGFAGGRTDNPTYKQICYEDTGHAEVVHIKYDPTKVTYATLLDTFWKNHDPTQVNRQGPDVGDQYRTVIFTYSPEQQQEAETSKAVLGVSGKFRRPIATQIVPATKYFPAEEYHQKYLMKRGLDNCHIPTGG
jgi:peptide-methionine (S)-S-oxide reductase